MKREMLSKMRILQVFIIF